MGIVLIKDRMSVKYLGTLKFIEEYLKLNKTIASQHEITTALYAAGHKGNFGVMFRILREHDILLTNNLIYSWNEEKNCNIHMAREVVKSLRKYVAERKAIAKAKNKENVVELSIAAPRNIKKRKKRKEDSEEKEEPITVLGFPVYLFFIFLTAYPFVWVMWTIGLAYVLAWGIPGYWAEDILAHPIYWIATFICLGIAMFFTGLILTRRVKL